MGRPTATSAARFRPFRTHAHVAVDQHTDRFLPGRNFLVGMTFAAIFVELGGQHFVNFIVFGMDATGVTLRPTAMGRRRWTICYKFIFQIGIVVIAAGVARRGCRAGRVGAFFSTATASTATTTSTTRTAIFATFAVARSPTRGTALFGDNVFVREWHIGMEVVVDKGLIAERFHRFIMLFSDLLRTRFVRRCLFFIATTTTAAATATATMFATFFIARTIEAEAFLGGWWFVMHAAHGLCAGRDEIVLFKNFSGRFDMRFWRPIFDQAIAKATTLLTFATC